jgi:hypothetical protein
MHPATRLCRSAPVLGRSNDRIFDETGKYWHLKVFEPCCARGRARSGANRSEDFQVW